VPRVPGTSAPSPAGPGRGRRRGRWQARWQAGLDHPRGGESAPTARTRGLGSRAPAPSMRATLPAFDRSATHSLRSRAQFGRPEAGEQLITPCRIRAVSRLYHRSAGDRPANSVGPWHRRQRRRSPMARNRRPAAAIAAGSGAACHRHLAATAHGDPETLTASLCRSPGPAHVRRGATQAQRPGSTATPAQSCHCPWARRAWRMRLRRATDQQTTMVPAAPPLSAARVEQNVRLRWATT